MYTGRKIQLKMRHFHTDLTSSPSHWFMINFFPMTKKTCLVINYWRVAWTTDNILSLIYLTLGTNSFDRIIGVFMDNGLASSCRV